MLLGGVDGDANGYVGRLLPNGAPDPAFARAWCLADSIPCLRWPQAQPVRVFVSGTDRTGFSGALIVRLLADGTLDTLFGRAGATSVDLKTRRYSFPLHQRHEGRG